VGHIAQWGIQETYTKFWLESLKRRDQLDDLRTNRRKILNGSYGMCGRVLIKFIWLKIKLHTETRRQSMTKI
jgi:hypothetical protein